MRIVTAGNWKYGNFIAYSIKQAQRFGYGTSVYDLGGLGLGNEWDTQSLDFDDHGYYELMADNFRSTARHKPLIVQDALNQHNEFCVYLDGDAILAENVDEILGDYDIGVTVRREEEIAPTVSEQLRHFRGWCNAGVLFFNNTEGTRHFIRQWLFAMRRWNDDQWALNQMIWPDLETRIPEAFEYQGVRIRSFPGDIYNYCYFPQPPPEGVKILHYRNMTWTSAFFKQGVDGD